MKSKKMIFIILICYTIHFGLVGAIIFALNDFGSRVELNEVLQAELKEDQTHAVEDAQRYLEEKYHMDFELISFEPYIFMNPNSMPKSEGSNWVRTHYYRLWTGEFTVDGNVYKIEGTVPENSYSDTFQLAQIHQAYVDVAKENMPHTFGTAGIEPEVSIHSIKGVPFFSTFYDGTNIGDLLKEHRMIIQFDTDEVDISDEFWEEVHKEAALFQEKYEGSDVFISTLNY